MANREIGKHLDGKTAGGPRSPNCTLVDTRNAHGEAGERSHRQPRAVPTSHLEPNTESRPGPTTAVLARADERQRLARDLHDGVQTEFVSLILRLQLAGEDRNTPPALAATFAALEDHAAAALASRREIAYDIYPLPLTKLDVSEAPRALAARAPINVSERVQALNGTRRRTSTPGRGTVLTISLPWPAAADGRR